MRDYLLYCTKEDELKMRKEKKNKKDNPKEN